MSEPRRALLVDDDSLVRATVRELLERSGFTVREAENGRRGAALLRAWSDVDLVVTDILMPESDGIELLHEVRRIGDLLPRRPKVLAISGGGRYADAGFYLDPARMLGADLVLPKPFTEAEMTAALRTLGLASRGDSAACQTVT